MESKDCILISDDDGDEEDHVSFADVSIQVIGHKKPMPKTSKSPAPNQDTSIIDLTDDSFRQQSADSYDSPVSSPPLIPPSSSPSPVLFASQSFSSSQLDNPSPTPSSPLVPPTSPPPDPSPLPPHAYESSSRSSFTDFESPNFKRQQKASTRKGPSPRHRSQKRPSPRSQASPKPDKQAREEAKRMKMREKEEEKLHKEANRANAANKALQNCCAIIDKNLLRLINDEEEIALRTLFDESMLTYRIGEHLSFENCISWTYKRTEVEDNQCVTKTKDADWILVVMDGSDYLKRILTYRDSPDDDRSIKKFICDTRQRSKMDIILIVYNLANHLKSERMKDARNYRKTFKDKFEGRQQSTDKQQQNGGPPTEAETSNGIANIGTTDLQDLRLMFEVETKQEHPDWKFHIEFYEKTQEVIQTIARYTSSIAKYEVKRKNKAVTNLDWAINMDKEKAVDPTKSSEDLTKLWTTQLQQFSQVTLPIAKAIAAEYPSPSALLDQYKHLSTSEAEELLAELYVQKNLRRQIGPNLSRKIHCFMTCRDPDVHIGYG